MTGERLPEALASIDEEAALPFRRIRVCDVQRAVARVLGVPRAVLSDRSLRPEHVLARHIAIHVAIEITGRSLHFVGERFERDHSTAHFAHATVANRRAAGDAELERVIAAVTAEARRRSDRWHALITSGVLCLSASDSRSASRPDALAGGASDRVSVCASDSASRSRPDACRPTARRRTIIKEFWSVT